MLFLSYVVRGQSIASTETLSLTMQSLNASGGGAHSKEGSVVYTVGAVFYTNLQGQSNTVMQHIQQSEKFGVEDIKSSELLKIVAYPNPSVDYIVIDIADYENENAQYQLFDFNGRVVESERIVTSKTKLSITHLSPSIYILKISVMNRITKIIEVVKQ